MTLVNRGGWWHVRFQVDGKEYRESTGLKATERNRNAALPYEERQRKAVQEGRSEPRIKARLFNDAAEDFLKWADSEHKDHPKTARRLRTSFASLTEFLGERPVMAVTEGSIEDYKAWRRSAGIREVTLRHDLHALSKFFRYAAKQRWARTNPLKNVRLPSDADAVRIHVLNADEERLYFAAAKGLLHDMGRLMLNQGCRPEELLMLRRDDVDLDRREMHIRQGKSRAARRTLDLTTESVAILARRTAQGGEWVFASPRSQKRHSARLNTQHAATLRRLNYERDERGRFKRDAEGNLIPKPPGVHFVLYDLRHTFATRFAEKCPDLTLLMRILGHSSLRMVTRYVHPTREAQKAAMTRFEESMNESAKQEMAGGRII